MLEVQSSIPDMDKLVMGRTISNLHCYTNNILSKAYSYLYVLIESLQVIIFLKKKKSNVILVG